MSSSETFPSAIEFVQQNAKDQRIIRGIGYYCLDSSFDATNPFIVNQYEFESGFYRGSFDFINPVNGNLTHDTPEAYGRDRVISSLLDSSNGQSNPLVLDIGAGTLDIARAVPPDSISLMTFMNADISGPWSAPDGLSSLERGTDKLVETMSIDKDIIINLQFDFNKTVWPFAPRSIDYIVSNMAFHHIRPDLKISTMQSMYDSLREGGKIIFTDVFQKDESGVRFTQAGLRGPEECGGYLEPINDFLTAAEKSGFFFDDNAHSLITDSRNYQKPDELESAENNVHATMAINKAIWFMELRK